MSFDYRACFTISGNADAISFEAALAKHGLALVGAMTGLKYNGRRVVSGNGTKLNFAQFIANANDLEPSATGRVVGDGFFFEFGFLCISNEVGAQQRVAWLETSDQNITDMAYALEDANTDSLRLLVSLFNALRAGSMAMGVETTPQQFMQFFSGQLSLAEIDSKIWTTIQPPSVTRAALLANPARRELVIDQTTVITGSFPGAENYFE